MQIRINPSEQLPNTTVLIVGPDTGEYARVTMDGDLVGSYSVLAVPPGDWDDDAVKAAVLAWFGLVEAPA